MLLRKTLSVETDSESNSGTMSDNAPLTPPEESANPAPATPHAAGATRTQIPEPSNVPVCHGCAGELPESPEFTMFEQVKCIMCSTCTKKHLDSLSKDGSAPPTCSFCEPRKKPRTRYTFVYDSGLRVVGCFCGFSGFCYDCGMHRPINASTLPCIHEAL